MTNTAQYLSIREAAQKLGVSIDTLRRWEKQNVISSERTLGGHRRYSLEQLIWAKDNIKKYTPRNITIPESAPVQIITETTTEVGFKVSDMPEIYSTLHVDQKKILSTTMVVFSLVLVLFLGSKVLASDEIKNQMIAGATSVPYVGKYLGDIASKLNITNQKGSIVLNHGSRGSVLQAATGTPSFTVNIDANFSENVNVAKDLTVGGNLILSNALIVPSLVANTTVTAGTDLITTGGNLTTTSATANLFNTVATTLNIGGAATTLSIGSTSGTTTINNNLAVTGTGTVTGKLTASGDFAVSGSSTLGSLTAGATTVSSLTDSGALTVTGVSTLGDLILTDTHVFNVGGSGSTVAYNVIGNSTSGAGSDMDADNDLYIEGDLEVEGNITGTITGSFDPGLTNGSVLFQGPTGVEGDSTQFFWDDTNNRLGLGNNAPTRTLDVTGTALITNNTTTNSTINLTSTGDFTIADAGTTFITFNSNGNVVLADGRLLDLSAVVHDDSTPQGLKLPQNSSFTNIADGEGYLAWNSSTNNLMTYDGAAWNAVTASNFFTDSGATTYLTSTTDNVAFGGTDSEASFYFAPATSSINMNPFGASSGNTGSIRFEELEANGDNYTGFKAPDNLAGNVVYALPTADATTNNQVLASNTAGQLAWIDVSSGAGSHWTSTGSIVHLVNNTDDLALGGSTADAALFFDVSQSGLHLNPFGAGSGNTAELRFEELEANGDNYTGFKAPDSLAGNVQYTLPSADATASNQVLASNGTGTLSWINITGGANSPFTKSGANVSLTTTTDELILGGSSPLSSAKFSIDGDTDQIQMIVQGNGTQTTNLVVFEQSDGTDVFSITNAGNLTSAGNLDINGAGTHDIAGTLNLSGNALTASGDLTVTPAGGDTDFVGNISTTGDAAINGGDITTAASTATLFNTNAATLSIGGASTTALNIGNGNTAYTAINLGSGSGGNTINIAGTGATGADTINIGTGGTAADTINLGSAAGATAINLTTGTGSQTFTSSVATGTLTSGAFVFKDTALSSGDMIYATASAITSGNMVKLGQGGNTNFTGNGLYMDFDNTGQGGIGFTGNFLKFDNATSTKFTVASSGNVAAAGTYAGTSGTNTRLQATGTTTGNTGNSSIYFLDSTGTTRGRFDTGETANNFGSGADGSLALTASLNLNTQDSTASVDANGVFADGIAYKVNMAVAFGANTVTTSDTPSGLAVGDEVLLINMQSTTGDLDDVGNYEFLKISSISTNTITFTNSIKRSYDGTTAANQKVIIQRVPQYTNVTLTSSGAITASAWDGLTTTPTGNAGYLTGIVALRATGNISIASGTSVSVNNLGYRAGNGGAAGNGGGANGESYDGFVGSGGGPVGSAGNSGGGDSGVDNDGAAPAAAIRAGGGGGGSDNLVGACGAQCGGGGGGGGALAGGGGGGGAGGYVGQAAGRDGGTGGAIGIAGGGGGGSGTNAVTAGNGGNAGSNGLAGAGNAGAVGTGSTSGQGGGGAGSGSNNRTGAGGGGGGYIGDSQMETMFLGSAGGGGGGAHSGDVGGNGGSGGGVVFIAGNSVSVQGTISATGNAGITPSGNNGGSGGGGSGGSIHLVGRDVDIGTSLVTATGGTETDGNNQQGGGGGGGNGYVTISTIGTTTGVFGSSSPTFFRNTNVGIYAKSAEGTYGTLHAGSIDTVNADLAENYVSGDDSISAGDVVSIVPMNVANENGDIIETKGVLGKANGAYDSSVVGIVSTAPGVTLGSDETASSSAKVAPLALSGRVPVKIASDSEEIHIGDYLTSSTTPGKAMKATKSGYTVGKALENWKPGDGDKIMAFVNLGYNMGSMTADGSFDTGNSFIANNVSVKTNQSLIDRIFGIIRNNSQSEATDSAEPVASESGTLNIAEALSRFTDRLETAEGDIALLKTMSLTNSTANPSGSVLGSSSGLVTVSDLVATNGINVGSLSLTNNSIDAIGTLKIQPSGLGSIEFQGNNIEIDTKGNLNIKSGVIIGNDNIRGSETVTAGHTTIQVHKSWDNSPKSVTITPSYNANVWVTNKTKDGFTINVSAAPLEDAQIDWFAIW